MRFVGRHWAWCQVTGAVGLLGACLLPWVRTTTRSCDCFANLGLISNAATKLGLNVDPPWTWTLAVIALVAGWTGIRAVLRRGGTSTTLFPAAGLWLALLAVPVLATASDVIRARTQYSFDQGPTTVFHPLFGFWGAVVSDGVILLSALLALLHPSEAELVTPDVRTATAKLASIARRGVTTLQGSRWWNRRGAGISLSVLGLLVASIASLSTRIPGTHTAQVALFVTGLVAFLAGTYLLGRQPRNSDHAGLPE